MALLVPVRCRRVVFEGVLRELHATRTHMSGQMRFPRHVSRILEHHNMLRVQTDGTIIFIFREHILCEIEDGCATVMTLFGEQGLEPTVRFRHRIVYDDQVSRSYIEQRRAR